MVVLAVDGSGELEEGDGSGGWKWEEGINGGGGAGGGVMGDGVGWRNGGGSGVVVLAEVSGHTSLPQIPVTFTCTNTSLSPLSSGIGLSSNTTS